MVRRPSGLLPSYKTSFLQSVSGHKSVADERYWVRKVRCVHISGVRRRFGACSPTSRSWPWEEDHVYSMPMSCTMYQLNKSKCLASLEGANSRRGSGPEHLKCVFSTLGPRIFDFPSPVWRRADHRECFHLTRYHFDKAHWVTNRRGMRVVGSQMSEIC